MVRLCQSKATKDYEIYLKEDLITIALNYLKSEPKFKYEDLKKLKKSELCFLLTDLPKTIEELQEIENKLIKDINLAFKNKEYNKIEEILQEASVKDYSNVIKYTIENFEFENSEYIFYNLFKTAEYYTNHDLIYFLLEHEPPAKTKNKTKHQKQTNYYYNLLTKTYNYLFGLSSDVVTDLDIDKIKVKITPKEEDKYQNEYFNDIAQELDVKSDNKYLLHIKDTSYTTIKIIDKLNNTVHYNYTFDKDQIIDKGQGEYIITDNITYNKYLKCMDIIDSKFNHLLSKKDIDEVINATKCQLFFIPKTLYELFFVREYIKTIDHKKHFWYLHNKNIEKQVNNYRFTLNNIIASELDHPTYNDLYNKLKELFNEIIQLTDEIFNNVKSNFVDLNDMPDVMKKLRILHESFLDKKSFKNVILKAFKLECSPLANLGYIVYRGSSIKKDIIVKYGQIFSLSYGMSLFAGLLYDSSVKAGAMSYNYITKHNADSYCIIIPFDDINDCVFYIPPLTAIESLFGSGEIFHAVTKGNKRLKHNELYLGDYLDYNKYDEYLKENHPSVLSCTPKELSKQFKQYKNTLITFN